MIPARLSPIVSARLVLLSLLATSLCLVTACRKQTLARPSAAAAVVSVAGPVERDIVEYFEATGTTQPLETVEVRARVQGFLQSKSFQPRQKVKQGDIVFIIDQAPYKAKVAAAIAEVQARTVALDYARFEVDRIEKLALQDAAAEVERVQNRSKRDAAEADLARAKASLQTAQIDLDFTEVKAQTSGRISRELVDIGNLVAQNSLLATIVNDESVYAYFDISEQDVLRLMRRYPQSRATTRPTNPAPVFLGLMDEDGYPHKGTLDYIDTKLDNSTGTLRGRAIVPNQDAALVAGLFARIRIPVSEPQPVLMVSERALGIDQGQRYVLVVNADNIVEYRRVKVGLLENGLRVIERGLTTGDRVIVNGLQRVRPGVTVDPKPVDMLTFAAADTRPASDTRPAVQTSTSR